MAHRTVPMDRARDLAGRYWPGTGGGYCVLAFARDSDGTEDVQHDAASSEAKARALLRWMIAELGWDSPRWDGLDLYAYDPTPRQSWDDDDGQMHDVPLRFV